MLLLQCKQSETFTDTTSVRRSNLCLAAIAFITVGIPGCSSVPIVPPESVQLEVRIEPEQEPDNWQELLPDQLELVKASSQKYIDFNVAQEEGWKPFGGEGAEAPLMGIHYYLPDGPDYQHGDPIDFSRPNNLMYAQIGNDMVLTGVAFVVRIGKHEPVPAGFAGPEDRWHVHNFLEAINAATEGRPFIRSAAAKWINDNYFKEGDTRYRLAMVHVWTTIDNPDGIFANEHRVLPYIKLGLPEHYAEDAPLDAAKGLHLATDNGCDHTLGGALWIANVSGSQKRDINAACDRAANQIQANLGNDADTINQISKEEWVVFYRYYQSVLTDDQKRRMDSLMEHHH